MAWLQLSLDLEALDLATVHKCCEKLGALSVTLQDAGNDPVLEPLPGEMPIWNKTRVIALFELAGSAPATRDALRRRLADQLQVESHLVSMEELPERDWISAWRKDARPSRFGERLWVCQDGQRPADPNAVIVDLDPGLAFGTGSHPSTALCLEWLSRAQLEGKTLIDYGCGSGILAVAAARLGASAVFATDIDEQALIATRENALKNGVYDQITVLRPDELQARETDILVANILSNPLRQLAPRFAELVRPGGQIALAGILQEQACAVQQVYDKAFVIGQSGRNGDWAILAGRRRADKTAGS